MKPGRSTQIVVPAAIAVALGIVAMFTSQLQADGGDAEQTFIQRVVAQTTRTGLAIRTTRELRAGTISGKHEGWMRVSTTLTPSGQFSWEVLEEGGSNRTREKVLRALLDTEAQACREGDRDAALTPANYVITPLGPTGGGNVKLRLEPRRRDTRLVNGFLIVSQDGYPVRLEGTLAKSPSFWVKSVRIVKHYERYAGVALPVSVESTADLKLFGTSTFTMRYSYTHVNGRTFSHAATTADSAQQ